MGADHDNVAQMRLPIILKTIEEIERTHRNAVEIADLKGIEYDSSSIKYYEDKLSIGFSVPATEEIREYDVAALQVLPSQSSPTGTVPTSFVFPVSRSFPVGASRVVGGSSPVPSVRPTSAADVPVAGRPDVSTTITPRLLDRSAAPEADEVRSAPVPDATEPAGQRRRRTSVKLEK